MKNVSAPEEFEAATLAACLLDPAYAIPRARALLAPADFTTPGHGDVFGALCAVADEGPVETLDERIDPLTVSARLGDARWKDRLTELLDVGASAANVEYYARKVSDAAQVRGVEAILAEGVRGCRSPDSSATSVAQETAVALLRTLEGARDRGGFRKLGAFEALQSIEERGRSTGVPGLATGFAEVDRVTHGFRPKELVVIGGVAKGGKTTTALSIARHNALVDGVAGAIVSAEMGREQINELLLSATAKVPRDEIARGCFDIDAGRRLSEAAARLDAAPLWVDDRAPATLDGVRAASLALKAKHPEIQYVIVDFLQLIRVELRGRRGDEELTAVSYGLLELAKQANVTVIATCQLNQKDIERRQDHRPQLADLQGSSGMVQAAHFCALTYRPAMYNVTAPPTIELDFPAGGVRRTPAFRATLLWDGRHARVDNDDTRDRWKPQAGGAAIGRSYAAASDD